jgi:hypothetical protein
MESSQWQWIEEFEKTEAPYDPFYKKDNESVLVTLVYLNKENEIIEKKKHFSFFQEKNVLQREELIDIVKKFSFLSGSGSGSGKRFRLQNIFVYHNQEDHNDIVFKNGKGVAAGSWRSLKKIESVAMEPTISLFQDLNEICILFTERNNDAKTRKWVPEKHAKTYRH